MRVKAWLASSLVRVTVVLALIAGVGLAVVPHYGISWDEEATLGVVDVNYQLVTQRGDPNDHRQYHRQYYGTWFNVAAEVVFKGQQAVGLAADNGEDERIVLLAQLRSKHVFTFLISLVTYGAVAGLVGMVAGWEFCWIGPVVLWLMPRFWGNSFFNPKDIPLAAMFALGTWMGACLIQQFSETGRKQSIGANRTTGYSLLFGLLVGFVAGTRVDSSVLALYVVLVDVVLQLLEGRSFRQILRFAQFYGLMLVTAALTIFALYPAAWVNPLDWYFAAFNFYYKENWPHTVLFKGVDVPADSLPWDYLPTWIAIATPAAISLFFGVGVLVAIVKYRGLSAGRKAGLLLVGLQIFGLPLFAIAYRATLFDSLRQVLYVLPGMAAVAGMAIAWVYQFLRSRATRLAFVGLLVALALPIAMDMAELHPYEYAYFNRVFGGLPAAEGRFDTDYWGVSMADSAMWVNNQSVELLVSSAPTISAELFAPNSEDIVSYGDFEEDKLGSSSSFYYLSLPRWGFDRRFPNCSIAYSTERQQISLARVKKCS